MADELDGRDSRRPQGQIDGTPVSVYTYRDSVGRRIALYLSGKPFRNPSRLANSAARSPPGTSLGGTVTILCSRGTHAMLVLGEDRPSSNGLPRP